MFHQIRSEDLDLTSGCSGTQLSGMSSNHQFDMNSSMSLWILTFPGFDLQSTSWWKYVDWWEYFDHTLSNVYYQQIELIRALTVN